MEQPVQSQARRHRRVMFIAPQDHGKADPFAPAPGHTGELFPESPGEIDASNDTRIIENLPPHFGKL